MRPQVPGVQIIAFDDAGRVLLLRHSYGSRQWMTPAGGLGRREGAVAAAQRELAEEVGCTLQPAWLLGVREEDLHGARNVSLGVGGPRRGTPCADGREVLAVGLFTADALPDDMPPRQRAELPGLLAAARAAFGVKQR